MNEAEARRLRQGAEQVETLQRGRLDERGGGATEPVFQAVKGHFFNGAASMNEAEGRPQPEAMAT